MQNYASKVSEGMALQLGCLELRYVPRSVLTHLPQRGGWGGCRSGAVKGFAGERSFQLFLCHGGGTWRRDASTRWISDVPPFSQEIL